MTDQPGEKPKRILVKAAFDRPLSTRSGHSPAKLTGREGVQMGECFVAA